MAFPPDAASPHLESRRYGRRSREQTQRNEPDTPRNKLVALQPAAFFERAGRPNLGAQREVCHNEAFRSEFLKREPPPQRHAESRSAIKKGKDLACNGLDVAL